MSTLLCIPILVQSIEQAQHDATAAHAAGADLIEFRIDEFFTGEAMASGDADSPETRQLLHLIADAPLPCIVTCRSAREGGHYEGDEMTRVALYERLGTAFGSLTSDSPRKAATPEHPPRYLDFELSSWEASANIRQKIKLAVDHPEQLRDLRTSLMLSMHDFTGRPADLTRRLQRMQGIDAAKVLKIAFRARSLRDNLELFDLLAERDRPTIALGMGEFGLMSRILAPKFGAFLTFASLRDASATAPGQPTVRELIGTFRFRAINPRTKVFGVIGWPIAHSLSPLLHNAGFSRINFDAVYLPLPIPGGESGGYENLKATLLELIDHPRLDFSGASITLPHKEPLVRLAREQEWEIDPLALAIGAGNTLAIDRLPSGHSSTTSPTRIRVLNTDATAALESLQSRTGPVAGRAVAIIGAGGVARTIAAALAMHSAHVYVVNRTPARALDMIHALQPALQGHAGTIAIATFDDLANLGPPLAAIINATPIGMTGGPAPSDSAVPVPILARLPRTCIVFDTVYNPIDTPTLRAAHDVGLPTLDGVDMFIRQAAAQFELWTGALAPISHFESLVRQHLAGPAGEAVP